MSPTNHLTLHLKNDLAEIERVGEAVEALCHESVVSAETLYAIKLALDEILTNVISYGYDDGAEHEIAVQLTLADRELYMEITDDARPFNPVEAPTPNVAAPLQDKPLGGLGIHLVRTLMDRLEYKREHERNILIMTKKIK